MCEISVIMSVYNESISEINASVDSIINQTFNDFELIIIIDNPARQELKINLEKKDPRVRVYVNKVNMGLAKSMNKAVAYSQGRFLARMDADDISLPERLRKEYLVMKNADYCLVCTGYEFMDENGEDLGMKSGHITSKLLVAGLPYDNTIHHPTVMMRKDVFEQVGGYRNFPCSQDYDLWLRMSEYDSRMYYIDEILFRYRIRSNSISQKNKIKQLTTWWYIQKLYRQRRKRGYDRFSEEDYVKYLKKSHIYDLKYCEDADKAMGIKFKLDKMRNENTLKSKVIRLAMAIRIVWMSAFYRKYYIKIIRYRIFKCIHRFRL